MKHKLESRLLGENINNLRYADNITIMAENEEELKSLLMKVKEEALRSQMDRVIALRQISVRAQCYSSILFRR